MHNTSHAAPAPPQAMPCCVAMLLLQGLAFALAFASIALPPPSQSAEALIRCARVPESPGCVFPQPPPTFAITFDFAEFGSATVRMVRSWSPVYVDRLWTLVQLGYFTDDPLYRFDYRNASSKFVVQLGSNLLPGVQAAWETERAVPYAVPPRVSNTRGRVAFALDAVRLPRVTDPEPDTEHAAVPTTSPFLAPTQPHPHPDT